MSRTSLEAGWENVTSVCSQFAETKDGKKYYDSGPQSSEMERLNKAFSRMHSFSAITNLVGLGITVWYGLLLSERLQ